MAITKKDIEKLANLARIEIKEEEQEELAKEIDQILEYVGQVSSVAGSQKSRLSSEALAKLGDDIENANVFREDEDPTAPETFSKELIEEFPHKEKNYLKVKKIL